MRALPFFLLTAVAAIVGHVLVVWHLPRLAMGQAFKVLSGDGVLINEMYHAPRQTPETRDLGRPAPEIAYSSCAYDLSEGPLRLTVPDWPDYYSVSFYDARARNFHTLNDSGLPAGTTRIRLVRSGDSDVAGPEETVVRSPSRRGAVLIRRLVASKAMWPGIDALRSGESCASVQDTDEAVSANMEAAR